MRELIAVLETAGKLPGTKQEDLVASRWLEEREWKQFRDGVEAALYPHQR